MSQRDHPGSITFSDESTGLICVVPASAVPEGARFAPGADGTVHPIVTVVSRTVGTTRTIQEYGDSGEVLRSTVQVVS